VTNLQKLEAFLGVSFHEKRHQQHGNGRLVPVRHAAGGAKMLARVGALRDPLLPRVALPRHGAHEPRHPGRSAFPDVARQVR
jgi:hypothetical protein